MELLEEKSLDFRGKFTVIEKASVRQRRYQP